MDAWTIRRRWLVGTAQCAGLGSIAATFELVANASRLRLPLTAADFGLLGVIEWVAWVVAACVVGGVVGGITHSVAARAKPSTALALQLAITGGLCVGAFVWPLAHRMWRETAEMVAPMALVLVPLGFVGVLFANARFAWRRFEAGAHVPWLQATGAMAFAVLCVGSVLFAARDTGGAGALQGDPNVLLVSVEGLSVDMQMDAGWSAPVEERLTAFTNAVSPTPNNKGGHATLLTGAHPIRHGVLGDRDLLSLGYTSFFEALAREGWATAGFVSRSALGSQSGAQQGLIVFDDDVSGGVWGIEHLALAGRAWRWLAPTVASTRAPSATIDRFESWLFRHVDVPFAAWVHLHADTPRPETIHRSLALVVDMVDDAGVLDRTWIGVVGLPIGPASPPAGRALVDDAVRTPLWMVSAAGAPAPVPVVDAQVRLMDVADTFLAGVGLDAGAQSEGVSLLPYMAGEQTASMWCPLVGQESDGSFSLGMRSLGVKYIQRSNGKEWVFDLSADPTESQNEAESQGVLRDRARRLLGADRVALDRLVEERM